MGVVGRVALAHGQHRLVEVGERAVTELSYHPCGRVPDGPLRRRLLLGLSHLGGHDGGHVVLAERLVGVVEHDLALARVLGDAGLEVVADGPLRHASPELVHMHMAAEPGPLPHVQRRLEVGLLAERQHADEQVDLGRLAGDRVDEPPAERRPGPVHLAGLAGLVLDALREAVGDRPAAVVAAELRVAHGHLAGSAAPLPVLVVEQPQVDAHSGHLLVDVLPVRLLERALAHVPFRVEEAVDLVVRHLPDVTPADVSSNLSRYHRSPGLVPAISKRRYRE